MQVEIRQKDHTLIAGLAGDWALENATPRFDRLVEDRALTPDDGGNPEAGIAIVRHLAEVTRQQFEAMQNAEREDGA